MPPTILSMIVTTKITGGGLMVVGTRQFIYKIHIWLLNVSLLPPPFVYIKTFSRMSNSTGTPPSNSITVDTIERTVVSLLVTENRLVL